MARTANRSVRVTAATAKLARAEGLSVVRCAMQSGAGYLSVYRGGLCLGEIWQYTGVSKWRVFPQGLPPRYRSYTTTQKVGLSALIQAHAAHAALSKKFESLNLKGGDPVPWSVTQKVQDRIRHITLARNACVLIGTRMMERGEVQDGVEVIARGHRHDGSKWVGIEWDILHAGPDVDKELLKLAMRQHQAVNDHHPEFWAGGIHGMPRLARAEMVCDWYARSQERGTNLRDWITQVAMGKFGFKPGDGAHKEVMEFVELLLQDPFAKIEG